MNLYDTAMALTLDDHLLVLLNETCDASNKWYNIGLGLKVSVSTLDSIRERWDDDSDRLREVYKPWLKGVDPLPTWKALIEALRNRSVGEGKLADQLETKYCTKAIGKF